MDGTHTLSSETNANEKIGRRDKNKTFLLDKPLIMSYLIKGGHYDRGQKTNCNPSSWELLSKGR